MTPSKVADRLEHAEVWEIDGNDHALGNLLLDAASLIRSQEAKLKQAEEALELAEPSLARVNRAHIVRRALKAIKGEG